MARTREPVESAPTETRTETRSFRLPTPLLETLRRYSRESGISVNELAHRYLDEGLRRSAHPLITFRDAAGGRRPVLSGTRLDVAQVIETVRNARARGRAAAREAAEYLGITEAQVRECIRYYGGYRDEVDAWIDRMHAISEREEEASRQESALLDEGADGTQLR